MSSVKAKERTEVEPSSGRLIATLGVGGLISGLLIVAAFEVTLPTIKEYQARMLREAVFRVLPGVERMRALVDGEAGLVAAGSDGDNAALFAGYDAADHLIGYAIPGDGPGFQDTIRLLYGYVPQSRRVVGMEVLDSRETPGLGDKIYKDADFVGNFRSLAVDPEIVAVKKGTKSAENQVDAITGATISSKAVVRIINETHRQWAPRLPAEPDEPEPGGTQGASEPGA